MLKKIIVFSLIFLFFCSNLAGQEITKSIYRHYEGFLANKFPITMEMVINDNLITGTYYYNKYGKKIFLKGIIKNNDSVEINEYSYYVPYSGFFKGNFKNETFSGVWTDVTGKKKLKFNLKEDYNHSAQLDFYHFKQITPMLDNNDDIKFVQKVSFVFPVSCPIRAAQAFVLSDMKKIYFNNENSDIEKSIRKYMADASKEYLSQKDDIDIEAVLDFPFSYSWEVVDSVNILYNDDDFLTIELNGYSYSGGAHGNSYFYYRNYDIRDGKQIKLWDFFDRQYKSEILDKIHRKIITDEREGDVFSMDQVEITGNFAITKKGVYFLYNNYEIGPYSSGIFELYFPYSEISDYIFPDVMKKLDIN